MGRDRAQFLERSACIACDSDRLGELSGGSFSDQPLRDFIEKDSWGENPMPYLEEARWAYVRCGQCAQAFHRYVLTAEWNQRRFSQWMTQEAIGVDRSAARRKNARHVQIFAEIDDLKTSSEGAKGFHALTLFEVLEHLDDPALLLTSLKDFLVPGGILIPETPDCSGVSDIKTRRDYLKIAPMEHINGFTPATLRAFAERLGFAQVSAEVAHVTAELLKVLKNEVRRVAGRLMRPTTQLYFRKL